jgi:hypothetical protein
MSVNQGWPKTVNSESLVQNIYIVGKGYQTSNNREGDVLKKAYPSLQS